MVQMEEEDGHPSHQGVVNLDGVLTGVTTSMSQRS